MYFYLAFMLSMVGSNGIEPSTSRLSGVRSNHLSYEPILSRVLSSSSYFFCSSLYLLMCFYKTHWKINNKPLLWEESFLPSQSRIYFWKNISSKPFSFSLERRWSSRTFRYGYLVTTSPQSLILPSTAASLQLAYRLRVFPTLMVWRAVCTRPGNVFTAVCWPAITSNSGFM